jgi:hypothetical protein
MENKQTAMTHLIEKILRMPESNIIGFLKIIGPVFIELEKEQIKDAFVKCWESNIPDGIECKLDAEQYYNETYGPQVDKK